MADRTPACPTCGSDDVAVRLAGCRGQQWELDVDPWHFNLPGYPGHREAPRTDRTPADVIAAELRDYDETNPSLLAEYVLSALAAAGFRVTPKPDSAADRPDHDLADRPTEVLAELLHHRATQNAIVRSYGIMPSSRPEDDDLDRSAAARLRQLSDRRTQLTGDTSVDIAITYGYEVGVEDGRAEGVAERDEYRRQLDTLRNAIGDIEDLRYQLDGLRGGRFTSSSANRMERIADAVDALAAVGDPKEGR